MQEGRSGGSLSPHIARDTVGFLKGVPSDEDSYVGYDIHPEDIEALYFDGLGVPRWENIAAENVEKQIELYRESFQKQTSGYPLIGRITDTDQTVAYTTDEVLLLLEECERLQNGISHLKAVRALQKLILAGNKAAARQMGLLLTPSRGNF